MEIILSKQCESLTGSLGKGFGYFIVGRWSRTDVKYRYYSQRSKWNVPPDGHLRFILACAELAQAKLYIADIRVTRKELSEAIQDAGFISPLELAAPDVLRETLSAIDIINLKNNWLK